MPAASAAPTAILLISCPDRSGIVAEVTSFIRDLGGNLLHADQHTDPQTHTFYMRVEWEGAGDAQQVTERFAPVAQRFEMDWQLADTATPQRVAIFVTKQAHCLWDLLQRHSVGELRMDVPLVISNHDSLARVAGAFDIPFRHVPVAKDNKAAAEAEMIRLLHQERIDLVVLARYMQILSPDFVAAFPTRIINVHHSFLPAFVGARPYHRAHERGVKIIGASAHYVTADLDQGPIIEQVVERVSHSDTVADLMRKGRDLERVALARAVRLHLHSRVLVYANKTAIFA